jgi:hypothetical protein
MTQQYLAGELSVLLARLQAAATTQAAIRDVARLRREAETGSVTTLPSLVVRALALADRLCWDSLERGDPAAFTCQGAICAELRDFGVCARLLQER